MDLNDIYKLMFEFSTFPVILTDENGKIIDANNSAAELSGFEVKELKGCLIGKLIPGVLNDGTHKPAPGLSPSGGKGFYVVSRSGTFSPVEVYFSSFPVQQGSVLSWTVRVISDEKKLLSDLQERVKEQLAFLHVTETLFQDGEVAQALQACVFHIRDGWQYPEHTSVRIKLADGGVFVTESFKESEYVLASDIKLGGNIYGSLEVFYTDDARDSGSVFLKEEKILIRGLARLISLYLEQRYALDKIRESENLIRKITDNVPGNTYQFKINESGDIRILFATEGKGKYAGVYRVDQLKEDPSMVYQLVHPDDQRRFLEYLKTSCTNLTDMNIQYRVVIDEMVYWRNFIARPEVLKDNEVVWYGCAHDITPIIEYINTLEQILFDISHVIRKPVATMLGLTGLIETTTIDEESLRTLATHLKTVTAELDTYVRQLNDVYYQKKLQTRF